MTTTPEAAPMGDTHFHVCERCGEIWFHVKTSVSPEERERLHHCPACTAGPYITAYQTKRDALDVRRTVRMASEAALTAPSVGQAMGEGRWGSVLRPDHQWINQIGLPVDLLNLGENWDGYGAHPLGEKVLTSVGHTAAVPGGDGSVQLEMASDNVRVEVNFTADGEIDFVYVDGEVNVEQDPAPPSPAPAALVGALLVDQHTLLAAIRTAHDPLTHFPRLRQAVEDLAARYAALNPTAETEPSPDANMAQAQGDC